MTFSTLLFDQLAPERAQARVRVGLVSAVLVLLGVLLLLEGPQAQVGYWRATGIAAAYWVFSFLWLLLVRRDRGHASARRVFVLLADLTVTSVTMHAAGSLGAFFYPVYLWIITGHGIRYGSRYLITAAVASVGGFATVLATTAYWHDRLMNGAGLLVGLVVVPVYMLVLLRELHGLNDKLQRALERSLYTASHDALTGLANRNQFFERLKEEIARAGRQHSRFAVLFVDLNGFKEINDTFGHQAGDRALRKLGERLRTFGREADLAARLGGDEFAVILGGIGDDGAARDAAQRIAELVGQPIAAGTGTLKLSASVGCSFFPNDGRTPDELVHQADLAMYQAKRAESLRAAATPLS